MAETTIAPEEEVPEDHSVPGDLLTLYEVLEYTGAIEAPKAAHPRRMTAAGPGSVIGRAEWGARPPKSNPSVIHPEGTTTHYEGPKMGSFPHESCATKCRGIQAFHMNVRKWADGAYTAIICPHGYIYMMRGWRARTAAQGTDAGNTKSYAACLLMGDGDVLTDAAKAALVRFYALARSEGGAGPRRWVHKDWHSTSCPGVPATEFTRNDANFSGSAPPVVVTPPVVVPPAPPPVKPVTPLVTLQRLLGVADDNSWGPITEGACRRHMIGWNKGLPNEPQFVLWLQRQANRQHPDWKITEDGLVGPQVNHVIVVGLGQGDGICGPNGFRAATR